MAPEQAASGKVDARADLYAVACVLYEMLTGRLPFVGPSAVAILEAKMNGSPEAPRDRAPNRNIPPAVEELVMRALARHANSRFQTATEMRRAIAIALEGPVRRRATMRLAGFAALAVTMAVSGVVLAGGRVPALRDLFPAMHPGKAIAAEVARAEDAPFDPSLGVTDPNDSWARAERGEDSLDDPGAAGAAAIEPPSEPVAQAEPEPPPAKGPIKAHPRKRKGETAHKSEAKHATAKPVPEPTLDDEPKSDDDKAAKLKTKSRHKKKSRLAHVEE